jgi:uncharacterized membrane protein YidH (DUF202 family)
VGCLILGALHIFFLLVLLSIALWFSNTKAVTSRGPIFLCHLSVSLIVAIALAIYYTKTQIDLVTTPNKAVVNKLSYKVAILLAFFCQNFFSAIAIRIRIIYETFHLRYKLRRNPLLYHFKYYPIDILVYALAILLALLKYFDVIENIKAKYFFIIIPVFYIFPIGYFTYKCREEAVELSDYYTNLRSLLFCFIVFSIVLVVHSVIHSIYVAVVWQFAIQSSAMVYTLDSIMELSFVELSQRKREREEALGFENSLDSK